MYLRNASGSRVWHAFPCALRSCFTPKKYQKPIYKCTKSHIYFIRYYEKKGQKNDEEHHGVGKDDYDDDNDEDGVEIPSNISIWIDYPSG